MPKEAICVTKKSVDDLIGILDQTIRLLKTNVPTEYTQLVKEAESEREIYRKVQAMMEREDYPNLCLIMADIKREGKIKLFTEKEEKVEWTKKDQENFEYYSTH